MDSGIPPVPSEPGATMSRDSPPPPGRPSSPLLHLILFLLTLLTTTIMGAVAERPEPFSVETLVQVMRSPREWVAGLPFSLAALFILGCHEMGHYVACRLYRIESSLPYFLPGPNLFGTFGAVIRIRSPFPTRRALFDVGIAGPLAGFVALVPILLYGLAHSTVAPGVPSSGTIALPPCLLLSLLYPLYFPLAEGTTITLHPLFVAAWLGLFATSLNLLPIGQLDGGHVLYALSPRVHALVSRAGVVLLVVVGYYYGGVHLIVFGILFGLLGLRHPRPIDETQPLGGARLAIAVAGLVLFVLTFFPLAPQVFGIAWR